MNFESRFAIGDKVVVKGKIERVEFDEKKVRYTLSFDSDGKIAGADWSYKQQLHLDSDYVEPAGT